MADSPEPPVDGSPDVTVTGFSIDLAGCTVKFPFQPYHVQKEYMNKVITALNTGSPAALESPTGTGKTLSLLCSVLAWVEKNKISARMDAVSNAAQDDSDWSGKYFKKTIFYASRTHSQLSKAMSELRRTDYRHTKAAVLGSRDQMCVHPELPVEESLTTKNVFCQTQVKAKTCRFYPRVEAMKSDRSFFLVRDIEDLVAKSKKHGCCPFYMSRFLQEEADVIFLPYNYLFDAGIRRKLNLNFVGAIIILDEGHNIDRVCEESASFSLSSTDIAVAIRDVTEDMQRLHDEFSDPDGEIIDRSYSTEDLMFMKERLMALEQEFDAFMKTVKEKGVEYRPDVLRGILENAAITEETFGNLEQGLSACYDVVVAHNTVNNKTRQQACTLQKVAEFIAAPYQLKVFDPANQSSFVVHTELEYPVTKRNRFGAPIFTPNTTEKPKGIVFNLWCLNPALGMKVLWNSHSVILTSGTLSPLSNVIMELGLTKFPTCVNNGAAVVSAEFGHVVDHEQFMIFAVAKGPNSIQLQYNFQNKDNLEYWEELGLTLLNFIRLIPDGVLVFFPSYQAMNKAVNCWKFKGLWDRLTSIKPIFSEETDKRRFNTAVAEYRKSVTEGRGGVLMGICRGKMSEGIDFSDQYGRAVVVCGLPYPPYYDPRVKSKMKYIDCLSIPRFKGQDWYRAEATKAVNQAIGRVIRHAQDVGVILLCDSKFEQSAISGSVSAWLRPVKTMDNFGLAIASLRRFFRRHPTLFKRDTSASPSKAPVCQPLQFPLHTESASSSLPSFTFVSKSSGQGSSGSGLKSIPLRQPEKPEKSCLASLADADSGNDVPRLRGSPVKSWKELIPPPGDVVVSAPAKRKSKTRQPFIPTGFTFDKNTPENKERARRMNEVKYFLQEMRRALEEESYNLLTTVLRKYQQDKDLPWFIKQLSTLFPKEDSLFADWFRECHKFLTGTSRTSFIEYCASSGYGVVLESCRTLQELPEP